MLQRPLQRDSPELCDSLGCVVHSTSPSFEESIRTSGLLRTARRGQEARTSVHFSAYRQPSGAQAYHDYGLHVYLRTKQLVMDGYEVTINTHGVVLCNYDIPSKYLVVSDIHPRNIVGEQTVPGEIIRRNRQPAGAASSAEPPVQHDYQAPKGTSEKKADVPTQPPVPAGTVPADDPTGDIFVKRLKDKGFATMAREIGTAWAIPLDVINLDAPENVEVMTPSVPADTAVTTDTLPRVTEVPASPKPVPYEFSPDFSPSDEPKLTEEELKTALQEASQEVAQEREEESKKRQKEERRAEQDESKAKKAKEVNEFLSTAPLASVLIHTKIIQAYLQEA
eukprot:6209055-Amphidinium_carterae.2